LENEAEDLEYSPNASFSEAVTKLKVFEEMEEELAKSGYGDITKLQLFPGKKQQCSKSVSSDLMYDCCNSFKGLTNDLRLSKCTADELALAEMKEKGQCHYIGAYDEKFMSLWTSRTEHVFCCFSSKLLRILQEEGRKQLGISWGTPEKPDCRGLSQEELSRIDFSKLDLSEAYETPPEVDLSEKFKALETRLKDQATKHNNENKSHD
jgi:conjugal transfer mating pair stabilization protein TraN